MGAAIGARVRGEAVLLAIEGEPMGRRTASEQEDERSGVEALNKERRELNREELPIRGGSKYLAPVCKPFNGKSSF